MSTLHVIWNHLQWMTTNRLTTLLLKLLKNSYLLHMYNHETTSYDPAGQTRMQARAHVHTDKDRKRIQRVNMSLWYFPYISYEWKHGWNVHIYT